MSATEIQAKEGEAAPQPPAVDAPAEVAADAPTDAPADAAADSPAAATAEPAADAAAERPIRGTRFNEVVDEEPPKKPVADAQPTPEAELPADLPSELHAALNEDDEFRDVEPVVSAAEDAMPIGQPSVLDVGYEDAFAHALDTDSDSSSVHSVPSYVMQKELVVMPDFFDELGEIPRLSEVSVGTPVSMSRVSTVTKRESQAHVKDIGRFVDPLTGEVTGEEPEEPEPEPEPEPAQDEEEEEEEEDEEIQEDDDLLCLLEVEEEKEVINELDDTAAFETFLEMETQREVRIEEEVDLEALEREEARRQLIIITSQFVADLIGHVVEVCEYVDPTTILRQHLDKASLMHTIELKLLELEMERKTRAFLNRKTVDHFRRKKAFRSIVEDPPDHVADEMQKFRAATIQLDQLLGREEEVKATTQLKVQDLEVEAAALELRAMQEAGQFDELVRQTVLRDTFERLPLVVDKQLGHMSTLREEISSVRFLLIQRQHSMAVLSEKLHKLEDLGNGLQMRQFETLQTEAQALDKKIEERNAELNKLRFRYNSDLHVMAHIKEKQAMMRNTLGIKKKALTMLVEEKQACRELLYELKLDRGRLRREIRELSFQGGLIDKPALMVDYDRTLARVDRMKRVVSALRTKHNDMLKKINYMGSSCVY